MFLCYTRSYSMEISIIRRNVAQSIFKLLKPYCRIHQVCTLLLEFGGVCIEGRPTKWPDKSARSWLRSLQLPRFPTSSFKLSLNLLSTCSLHRYAQHTYTTLLDPCESRMRMPAIMLEGKDLSFFPKKSRT